MADENKVSHADLVRRAQRSDDDAYLALVTAYKGMVASSLYSVIPDLSVVDELTEDAFAEAWRKLDTLRRATSFGAWVRKIARRLALKHIRARSRQPATKGGGAAVARSESRTRPPTIRDVEDIPAGPGADPYEQLAIRELYERVALEIERLPKVYRDTLGLRYFQAMSCKEIASALGLPIGTVTMQLSWGSRLLRGHLSVALREYLER